MILLRSNPGTGHYTQVVWADTEELGCGMVYYQGDSFFETLIVCNYAKGGNFLGKHSDIKSDNWIALMLMFRS